MSNNAPDVCELCFGTQVQSVPGKGARPCPACVQPEDRVTRLRAQVPARYRDVTLQTIEPRSDLHSDQIMIIDYMRRHPDVNYYFCGDADTGKTHFMYALYDHALTTGRYVFISSLFEMVRQAKALFGTRGEGAHMVQDQMSRVLNDMDQPGVRYSVFIDDIDKARPTDFVAELFFNYVDTIYRNKHQLVVTSQLDPEKRVNGRASLIEHFTNADPRYSVGLVRRLYNPETAIWRMFK